LFVILNSFLKKKLFWSDLLFYFAFPGVLLPSLLRILIWLVKKGIFFKTAAKVIKISEKIF